MLFLTTLPIYNNILMASYLIPQVIIHYNLFFFFFDVPIAIDLSSGLFLFCHVSIIL